MPLIGETEEGALPKALIDNGDEKYIAKFSSQAHLYSVFKAEFIAMRLAMLIGIDAPPVRLAHVADNDVLLIGRFDRRKVEAGF